MALAFTAASSQYLSRTGNLAGVAPCSFACWYMPTNNTGAQSLISVGTTTTNANYFYMLSNIGQAEALEGQQGGTGIIAFSTGTLTVGAWNHVVAVFTSKTAVTIYLNGVPISGAGALITPGTLNETLIGAFLKAGVVQNYANGAIAYPAIWSGVALSSGDVTSLYNSGGGLDPRTVQPSFVSSFSPLQGTGPYIDVVTLLNWTIQGSPTMVADPFPLTVNITTPFVATTGVTSITFDSAILGGSITSENSGGNSTVWGFNYGLTASFGNVVQNTGSFTTGNYSNGISGLAPGITYFYQAFATNSGGNGFSAPSTFMTSNAVPGNKGEVLYNGPNKLSHGTAIAGRLLANLFNNNQFDGWGTTTNGGWAGIDCGAPTMLTRILYTPDPVAKDLVIGCTLNGDLADATFTTPDVLYTFPNTGGVNGAGRANTGLLGNQINVSPAASYRYYMVKSPANAIFSFVDIDFIGSWASGVYSQPVAPIITPPGGHFDQPTVIQISSTTTSASIYYTLDGSTPTASSSPYIGPFVLSSNTQINAIAIDKELTTPSSRVTTSFFFCPSVLYCRQLLYDNRNIQAQISNGCIFLDPVSGYWYLYSQCHMSPVEGSGWEGVGVSKSADLRNWIYDGNICGAPPGLENRYAAVTNVRCQVFYNSITQNYVMWSTQHTSLNVWTSTTPDGTVPWTLAAQYTVANPPADGHVTPTSGFYGDLGSFIDPVTGFAYIIYNWNSNINTAFSQLDPANYTNTLSTNTASYPSNVEAHTLLYHNGTYFWIFSGEQALSYALNQYSTATSPIGPWTGLTTPFVNVAGAPPFNLAYDSQTDQVLSIPGRGPNAYIWIGDDFDSNNNTFSQQYSSKVILPITFPAPSTISIAWQNSATWFNGSIGSGVFAGRQYSPWSLDTVFPTVSGAPKQATGVIFAGGKFSWTNNETKPCNIFFDSSPVANFSSGVISEVVSLDGTPVSSYTPILPVGSRFFRIRTVNVNGTSNSNMLINTIAVVTVQAASPITGTTATLNGTITNIGSGNPTVEGFNYGLTTGYGASASASGSFSVGAYSLGITGLTPGTLYHYQAFATNAGGTAVSSDKTFTTPAAGPPTVIVQTAAFVFSGTVTFSGTITSDGGNPSFVTGFNYGLTSAYGSTVASGALDTGVFTANVTGLTTNALYHYQAFATNTFGTGKSQDIVFALSSTSIAKAVPPTPIGGLAVARKSFAFRSSQVKGLPSPDDTISKSPLGPQALPTP